MEVRQGEVRREAVTSFLFAGALNTSACLSPPLLCGWSAYMCMPTYEYLRVFDIYEYLRVFRIYEYACESSFAVDGG